MSAPPHAVEEGVDVPVGQRIRAAELGVEVGGVGGHVGQRVVHLVEDPHRLEADVLHRDLAVLSEGHLPVAVERVAGVDADRQGDERGEGVEVCVGAGEEVADRHFDGGRLLAVPVEAQDGEAVVAGGRHPDLLDRAGAVDIGEDERLAGIDGDAGAHFPAGAEVAGGTVAGVDVAAALALGPGRIFGGAGSRLRIREAGEVSEVESESVECAHGVFSVEGGGVGVWELKGY